MAVHHDIALPQELQPAQLHVGADIVHRYAELTADFNPIHLDPEFAARTPFGAPIIHGTLGLNLVVEAIEKTFGTLPAEVAIEVRFSRPVPVGATVLAGGSLRDPRTGTYEIFVATENGERALEGTCVIGMAG
ncbi:MaoC family dehydratase [Bosea lathyri]|uniref:MaoC like domain-containing protein n=1 Tax=Bosea lathyri TaxID=1036778 RepID=A0A1H5ZU55_9HYPH|nr:MaoC/PaaZ C-terminal domain-containing protein [Bosea lathyri]SEG39690.1 MaoC like domain-containing protein [Bosea lathyri]